MQNYTFNKLSYNNSCLDKATDNIIVQLGIWIWLNGSRIANEYSQDSKQCYVTTEVDCKSGGN